MQLLQPTANSPSEQDLELLGLLTDRQWSVLVALGEGLNGTQIATIPNFKCSRKTVETHIAAAKRRLRLTTINQLIIIAAKLLPWLHEKGVKRVRSQKVMKFEFNDEIVEQKLQFLREDHIRPLPANHNFTIPIIHKRITS